MKRIIFLLVAITIAVCAFSQEDEEFKSLFGNKPIRVSGFGGPIMNFSAVDGEFAHFMGGGGGAIINDFFIGGFRSRLNYFHSVHKRSLCRMAINWTLATAVCGLATPLCRIMLFIPFFIPKLVGDLIRCEKNFQHQ
jgi:hypothetical protein